MEHVGCVTCGCRRRRCRGAVELCDELRLGRLHVHQRFLTLAGGKLVRGASAAIDVLLLLLLRKQSLCTLNIVSALLLLMHLNVFCNAMLLV